MLSDADLGTALLAIGAGAIPAMMLMGRVYDRQGGWVAFAAMAVLAATGALTAWLASGLLSVVILLALVGAVSGAADVSITALTGSAQRRTGQPVLLRAYGMFSVGVVVCSLGADAALAYGLPPATGFVAVFLVALAVDALMMTKYRSDLVVARDPDKSGRSTNPMTGWRALPHLRVLLLLGGLGALASAIENAHQSFESAPFDR